MIDLVACVLSKEGHLFIVEGNVTFHVPTSYDVTLSIADPEVQPRAHMAQDKGTEG